MNKDYSVLWNYRRYLTDFPSALPLVLYSCNSWCADKLPEIYAMIKQWQPLPPIQAIQLLLPQ